MSDEQKQKYREARKNKYYNITDEQKQKQKDYQKTYRKNMSDEQKQKYREAINDRKKISKRI